MKKFILTYHAPQEVMARMANATPEQKAAGMKPWMDWKDFMGDKIVDFGSPVMGGTIVNSDGQTEVCTKEISGYSIIAADDLNHVQSLLANHPYLTKNDGSTIGVHEYAPM
ncbi:MAG: hypothetical protein COA58_14105 [Bacteroidetes bacterium]|nr:MAG: hypothetical protein COA58_14105 [Bacteroidota bacterium]